jgi:hypothetical protein
MRAPLSNPFLITGMLLSLLVAGVSGCAVTNPDTTRDLSFFEKSLDWNDDAFKVQASGDKLTIRTFGMDEGDEVFEHTIDGRVTGADAADLNHDGFPEVVVYVTSVGSGSYGSVIAYSSNDGRSMRQVTFPPTAENSRINEGYMGHDKFTVAEDTFVQSFPVFRPGDTNARPTGPTRQVQYALVDAEGARALVVSRTFEN